MRLSVIIPVYNEASTVAEIIRRVRAVPLVVSVGYGDLDGRVVELEREIIVPLLDEKRDAERRAFYVSLDRELALVQEFRPYTGSEEPAFIFDEVCGPAVSLWQRERPGPKLKIYRVKR